MRGPGKSKRPAGGFLRLRSKKPHVPRGKNGKKISASDEVFVILQGADMVKKQLDFQVVS